MSEWFTICTLVQAASGSGVEGRVQRTLQLWYNTEGEEQTKKQPFKDFE